MVRLIAYNLEYCEGMSGRILEYLKFWRFLRSPPQLDQQVVSVLNGYKPDILALVEVDRGSFRVRNRNEINYFEHKLELKSVASHVKYNFVSFMRLFKYIPILKDQSNALISRYKLKNVKHIFLSEGVKRVVIKADIYCPKKVTLFLVHLALKKKVRMKQIREIIPWIKKTKNPVILMGDFNTLNGDEEIKLLMEETHLTDAIALSKKSKVYTYPSWHPKKRLDYILVSKEIKVKDYGVIKINFSDHLPLYVDFKI